MDCKEALLFVADGFVQPDRKRLCKAVQGRSGKDNGNSLLLVEADRSELMLLFAVHISGLEHIILEAFGVFIEIVAERFQRIELFVAQQHIHAAQQNCGVFG